MQQHANASKYKCNKIKQDKKNAGSFSVFLNLCSNPRPYIGCQGAISHFIVSATSPFLPKDCPCSRSQVSSLTTS